MSHCPTVQIKSDVQGIEYFVINKDDFDPEKHELLEASESPETSDQAERMEALKAALTAKGVKFRANATEAKLSELLEAAEQ